MKLTYQDFNKITSFNQLLVLAIYLTILFFVCSCGKDAVTATFPVLKCISDVNVDQNYNVAFGLDYAGVSKWCKNGQPWDGYTYGARYTKAVPATACGFRVINGQLLSLEQTELNLDTAVWAQCS